MASKLYLFVGFQNKDYLYFKINNKEIQDAKTTMQKPVVATKTVSDI